MTDWTKDPALIEAMAKVDMAGLDALVERVNALRREVELRWTGTFADNTVNTLDVTATAIQSLTAQLAEARDKALEEAAVIADHHRNARRAAHTEAHRRGAKVSATSLLARSLEAQQLAVAIRALKESQQ